MYRAKQKKGKDKRGADKKGIVEVSLVSVIDVVCGSKMVAKVH